MNNDKDKDLEEAKEELKEAEAADLPLPNATIVRLMKDTLSQDKMIKKEVKVAMNKFLGEVLEDVTRRLDEFPYATIDYSMFREAIKPYKQAKEIQEEKLRMMKHLDVIISDCRSVQRDLERKLESPKTNGTDVEL